MVADAFPVDQYYVLNPDHLFEHSLDDLIIDTDNDVILEGEFFWENKISFYKYLIMQHISNALDTKCP